MALVTGASSGIGAAIAEHLAVAGAKVALAARRIDRLKELQARIEDKGGVAITIVMDVCDEEQVRKHATATWLKWISLNNESGPDKFVAIGEHNILFNKNLVIQFVVVLEITTIELQCTQNVTVLDVLYLILIYYWLILYVQGNS